MLLSDVSLVLYPRHEPSDNASQEVYAPNKESTW